MDLFCLICAVVVIGIAFAVPIYRFLKRKYTKNTFILVFAGIYISLFFLMFMTHLSELDGGIKGLWQAICYAFYRAAAVFVFSGDYISVFDHASELEGFISPVVKVLAACLFVLAPCMTFGFVISFFGSLKEKIKLVAGYRRETYVFSAVNDQSIALANDLLEHDPGRMIVFAHVSDDVQLPKRRGIVPFSASVTELPLHRHSANAKICICLLDEGDTVTRDTLKLVEKFGTCKNMILYMFAETKEAALMQEAIDSEKLRMQVRRINEPLLFVYRYLYDNGKTLFDEDLQIAVVGLGSYGREMFKAVTWYAQMPGYELKMHGFGEDDLSCERLRLDSSELFDEKHNKVRIEGEAVYNLDLHTLSGDLPEQIAAQVLETKPRYIFLDLEDDTRNLETATAIRILALQQGIKIQIVTMIRDTEKNRNLQDLRNRSNQPYEIAFIGSDASRYSEEMTFHSDLEAEGLRRHMQYCDKSNEEERIRQEKFFYRYEYNYRSSIASAIHKKAKLDCKVKGADLPPEERTKSELNALRVLEHRRWNAYMRSEGFVYGPERNNLAKVHPDLVPFDQLSLEEQIKDDD